MNRHINIQVDLSRLEKAVKKMGTEIKSFDIGSPENKTIIELERVKGIEIGIKDLEVREGLLHYKDMQVVLFIPDHSRRNDLFDRTIHDGSKGNKFHIGQCQKLDEMQRAGRFDRYSVSRNPDGKFEIYGKNDATAVVELNVCQFCLGMLNYKGAAESPRRRWQVAQEFDINEFFASYSSLFKELPRENDHSKVGYTDDWPEISLRTRERTAYTCQSCTVNLSHHKNLLHVHHKNGVKQDNSHTNLEVLCADCHRKEPCHQCMHVSHSDIQLINRLRQEQGIITANMSWDEVFKYADPGVMGALNHARNLGYMPPVVSFKLEDRQGNIIRMIEAVWLEKKQGVYLGEQPPALPALNGWKFYSIQEALNPKKGLGGQDQLSF